MCGVDSLSRHHLVACVTWGPQMVYSDKRTEAPPGRDAS